MGGGEHFSVNNEGGGHEVINGNERSYGANGG